MQKSRIGINIALVVLAIVIVGCAVWFGYMLGRQSVAQELADAFGVSSSASSTQSRQAEKTFDGSAFSDTGAGTMILKTAGGTSENGNVPQVVVSNNQTVTQIGIDYTDGDGSACTVYVDGIENSKMNASQRIQNSITLEGKNLEAGKHKVELVRMDGDAPAIYKSAEFEIVK